ncbi:MAG: HAMP domain-containing sensor histidine kinase [Bacteroidales bacterium]|nr:HAMP domain-containing sensor histidine kinase [Bacteroidales bacterium]
MRFKHIRYVVLLGAFAIIGIIAIQLYFIKKEWSNKEKQFAQTVTICLRNVASKIYKINNATPSTPNPVRQLSSNYFVVDVNSEIDANILEHYLKTEFDRYNIQTDFEFGIYNCETNVMEYGNYLFHNGVVKQDAESVALPKYSGYNYYFGVNFPLLNNTIAGDMTMWFFLVGILAVSVVFFVYSIFVILQQKRLSELQRDFINTMTHEFKTPIASINIAADVISNPQSLNEPSRILTYGSVIKQEVNRLNDQVDKVLQIARIEKSGFHLRMEMLDLNAIINQAVENCLANHGDKVSIKTELAEDIGEIQGDRMHLTNIFYNLLDNAVKYAGETPEIVMKTWKAKSKIQITVSDNGPGITRTYQKRVFQKFYRIPTANVHDVKGFGLGLFYVKSICDAHHWKISLDPSSEKGTTFILEINQKPMNG